tara:strand:+ start:2556 stop:3350 length:795 start_codon:yes stop_codon:yes gene_type:complete
MKIIKKNNFNSTLKEKLNKNELTIGSWITIPSCEIVEVMRTAKFEWLVIDLEHTSINIDQCKSLIRTIQGEGMQSLVRVSSNSEVVIKRVLDSGANGVIVPMIKNKNDAMKALSYAKYPPYGKRGVGLSRAQKYGTGFNEYKEWIKNEVVVIAQIEHIESVKNIDEILSVEGIDGYLIGPYDLSASMGYPGEYNRKEVKSVLKNLEKSIKKSKKSLGFHVIETDNKFIIEKIKKGYNLIAYSIDFLFLGDMVRNEMSQLSKKLK